MSKGFYQMPYPVNEEVRNYEPKSKEVVSLLNKYDEMYHQKPIHIPLYIGKDKITTDLKYPVNPPHDHKHKLGEFSMGNASHVEKAIECAMEAKEKWSNMSWENRATIFLKAADLLAGPYRDEMNAATMLCQSKNVFQAEIDAACELIDFLRFNVAYMQQIYAEQPESADGILNRLEYRPLEGFVFAITPFNFTAIAANLCAAPAMMGNVVVWKPAEAQMYSAHVIMKLFKEAGLPDGVINMVVADGPTAGDVVFNHKDFAGLHFTGSTAVFKHLWATIGTNINKYRSYPRIVGETGGKDFIVAHTSANPMAVAAGISRGAFEFQGQKCSAASRVYIPKSMENSVLRKVIEDVNSFKMGATNDPSNFINAVISETSFDKISEFIDFAKKANNAEIIVGGRCDKSKGYFIQPTVIKTTDPKFKTMCEEIFGPVVTVFVYEDENFESILQTVNETSEYALTGAVYSQDRYALELAMKKLENSAGNFYINDKPTGAVVGQQPFGGARGSGTNDKAGSYLNLLRWVSPRTIKEALVPATDYRYPFLG
ncbi:MAG: L-glutamate gamma-semialdehyde dehydrogenase [Flavobacteriales bacterium]|jgi:1-pyrroline-5-carboxylate dehydrogenase|nr:L-glutamate gamma-semialdehyde dehydrogenase [Flavobacteriales bacterium]MDG1439986.1 L-glutamate gamma-semialdehyde dehydrogenase [Flavobacteriales bacterium]MDG1798493.1 L-glutamate gamma-semialdehyde dehydrogenase [Flavobacteriales bacterium]